MSIANFNSLILFSSWSWFNLASFNCTSCFSSWTCYNLNSYSLIIFSILFIKPFVALPMLLLKKLSRLLTANFHKVKFLSKSTFTTYKTEIQCLFTGQLAPTIEVVRLQRDLKSFMVLMTLSTNFGVVKVTRGIVKISQLIGSHFLFIVFYYIQISKSK